MRDTIGWLTPRAGSFPQPTCRPVMTLLATVPAFAPNGGPSMEISEAAIQQAEQRLRERMEMTPRAIDARYDGRVSRVMVSLS